MFHQAHPILEFPLESDAGVLRRLIHDGGNLTGRLTDAVLNIDRTDVEVVAHFETHGDDSKPCASWLDAVWDYG